MNSSKIIKISLIVWLILMAFVAGWVTYHRLDRSTEGEAASFWSEASGFEDDDAAPVMQAGDEISNSRRNAIVRAIEKVAPATVSISVTQVRVYSTSPFGLHGDPLWDYFFPELKRQYRQYVQSMGSGFIINPQGYLVTNYHVVEYASEIKVNLPDGREFNAEYIGSAPLADLAILKVEGEDLPFVNLGNSDGLIIGEWAIALGNPFGYIIEDAKPSVTVGVVSALERNFEVQQGKVYRDMIQTDAAINPGNSGGPLANSLGEVIGVNSFIVSKSGGSEGIGFAIPINTVKKILQEVLQYGEVRAFWTGLEIQELNRLIAHYLDLQETEGVIITSIQIGSPAEEAGLEVGDIIKRINDVEVKGEDDLIYELYDAQVGDVVKLTILRDNKEVEIKLELKEYIKNQ
ncbi:trypsin-like peptidase domain-containing protein [bacterium]|nr:trypsin-like peptidase domain-containing protein [bacterium]